MRYFAHFLDAIIFGIGYLLPLFTAKRQTIADMVMETVCLLDEPPQAPRSHTPRPKVRMALGVVVLASAAVLTVLACLTSASQWVCTSGGRLRTVDLACRSARSRTALGPSWIHMSKRLSFRHCGPRGS